MMEDWNTCIGRSIGERMDSPLICILRDGLAAWAWTKGASFMYRLGNRMDELCLCLCIPPLVTTPYVIFT